MLALRERVAHAAHDALRCSTAASAGERDPHVTFGTLRSVVHSFGAHAAELVKPLGGEADGGQLRGRGEAKARRMSRGALKSLISLICTLDAAAQLSDPAVTLDRRRCADVILTLRLHEHQHELPVVLVAVI